MPSTQRYVVVGVVSLALVVAMALARGFQWLWVQLGWHDPRPLAIQELPLTALLAYGVAAVLAIVCLKQQRIAQLANEVVAELMKVTWPKRAETSHATTVVIVAVLVCSAYLGMFDAFWLWLTDWVLGVQPAMAG